MTDPSEPSSTITAEPVKPGRPTIVPEELWDPLSHEHQEYLANAYRSMESATAEIVRIASERKATIDNKDEAWRLTTDSYSVFQDILRADAEARLRASRIMFETAMWRAQHEFSRLQREADLAEANRRRDEDNRRRDDDMARISKEREDDRRASKRVREDDLHRHATQRVEDRAADRRRTAISIIGAVVAIVSLILTAYYRYQSPLADRPAPTATGSATRPQHPLR